MDNLPDWVAIGVAVVALAVSAITLWIQLVDRRRADASVVDVFFDGDKGAAMVKNAGSRSVYDVRVKLTSSGTVTPLKTRRVFRIGPGEDHAFAPDDTTIQGGQLTGPDLLKVRADFTDWSGRRWRRTNDGKLRRAGWWNRLPVR